MTLCQCIASLSEFDASLAPVMAKHMWMFPNQHLGMEMPKKWMPAFSALCDDIGHLLGNQRHGFHWRYLGLTAGKGGGEPLWLWRFKDDGEILLFKALSEAAGSTTSSSSGLDCQLPASDPGSDLFQGIQEWVHNARQLALESGRVRITPDQPCLKKSPRKIPKSRKRAF
jgi:hypothetical protein